MNVFANTTAQRGTKARICGHFQHKMVRTREPSKRKRVDIVVSEQPAAKRQREPYVPPPIPVSPHAALPGSSFQRSFPAAFRPLPLHLVRLVPNGPLVVCALGELPEHVQLGNSPRPATPLTPQQADDEDFCHVFLSPHSPALPLPVLPSDEDCEYYDRGEDPPRPLYAL